METTQEALDKLAALAPDELPKWLHENGYRGERYNSSQCILAMYLETTTGMPHTCWSNIAMPRDQYRGFATIPDHIVAFMRAFDRGDYPALALPPR